jgi:hypothetical protein
MQVGSVLFNSTASKCLIYATLVLPRFVPFVIMAFRTISATLPYFSPMIPSYIESNKAESVFHLRCQTQANRNCLYCIVQVPFVLTFYVSPNMYHNHDVVMRFLFYGLNHGCTTRAQIKSWKGRDIA